MAVLSVQWAKRQKPALWECSKFLGHWTFTPFSRLTPPPEEKSCSFLVLSFNGLGGGPDIGNDNLLLFFFFIIWQSASYPFQCSWSHSYVHLWYNILYFFFLVWTNFLKVVLHCLLYCFCFVFGFQLCDMRDLSSLTRDWMCTPWIGPPNYQTTRKVPRILQFLK